MRVYVEGEDYLRWVEDFENNEMGLGLTERENGEVSGTVYYLRRN